LSFNTPILFLVFNRYNETVKVFQEIKKVKPKYLFLSADGPRLHKEGEKEVCDSIKFYILQNIDWECSIETRFQAKNVGCKLAVSTAIQWFFKHVEEGIIIEDDCLPNLSFFKFCEEMLKTYKHDNNIFAINGCNFGFHLNISNYIKSKYLNVWGWATWRRSSNIVDYSMTKWINDKQGIRFIWKNLRKSYFDYDYYWFQYWKYNFDSVASNDLDTWDYQWQYTAMLHKMKVIVPTVNLIKNIGFGINATHTTNINYHISDLMSHEFLAPYFYNSSKQITNFYENSYVKIRWHLMTPRTLKFYISNYINIHFIQYLVKKLR